MNKAQIFETELEQIQNLEIRQIVKNLLNKVPDYFFIIPASSSGKYHPDYARGEGGLVRHTKATIKIALDLFNLNMYKDLLDKRDYIISALILHDTFKQGVIQEHKTVSNHPILAANFIITEIKGSEIAHHIAELVETHMGQWNMDYETGEEILRKPETPTQSFVHLCDYLASRKGIEIVF